MDNNSITVSIKDFQIIEKATLTFNKGLNCIIGPSNNGKSAIFRAIMSLLYNEPGTNRIRTGCNSYMVGLQMNGNTVLFQKGTKESVYKINGVMYQKPGRVQLEEVANATGIKELNLNGKNEQLNFWYQMEKPFLLDRSETDLFRFIVDSGKDNRTTLALKDMVSDRQTKNSEITQLQGKIEAIEESLKSLDQKLVNADEHIAVCNKIIELGPKIKQLESMIALYNEITEIKDQLAKTESKLKVYHKVLGNLATVKGKLEKSVTRVNVYSILLNDLTDSKNKLSDIDMRLLKIKNYSEAKYSENINKALSIARLYAEITNINKIKKDVETKLEMCNNYKCVDEDKVTRVSQLYILKTSLVHLRSQIDDADFEVNKIDKVLSEIKTKLATFKVCPLCNRPF